MPTKTKAAEEPPERRFYLEDGGPDSVLGLTGWKGKIGASGEILPAKPFTVEQLEELERMAATPGNPVSEGEPKGIK